jgi:molybdopterin molybdotransferase
MIDIDKAQQIIMRNLPDIKVENRGLLASQGLILAEDIRSTESMPGFSNSAMDGFAVAFPGDSTIPEVPFQFSVIGESRAGNPYKKVLEPGTAVSISTGAMIPDGTDRVIIQVNRLGQPGSFIRFQGEEVRTGKVITGKSRMLTPPMISFIGSFGITEVKIYAPPRISVLTTGEELVAIDQTPGEGQIRDTNSIFVHMLLRRMNITPVLQGHIADDMDTTINTIEKASELSDILVICGGVSVGEHDHVKSAAESLGFQRHFWKVAQKPGKPFYFASRDNVSLFGLPGNPGSVAATSVVYLYPAVRKLLGQSEFDQPTLTGRFEKGLKKLKPGRAKIHIVKIISINAGIATLESVVNQKSHMLSGLVNGDGFIIIPKDVKEFDANRTFNVMLFPWSRKGLL